VPRRRYFPGAPGRTFDPRRKWRSACARSPQAHHDPPHGAGDLAALADAGGSLRGVMVPKSEHVATFDEVDLAVPGARLRSR
jgi:hypothetical protein